MDCVATGPAGSVCTMCIIRLYANNKACHIHVTFGTISGYHGVFIFFKEDIFMVILPHFYGMTN